MKKELLAPLIILAISVCAAAEADCDLQDEALLACPAVTAPLVTGLRAGFVELAYTVERNGTVHNIRVIKSGGDERWIDAAKSALALWKYRASAHAVEKTQKFVFEFDG